MDRSEFKIVDSKSYKDVIVDIKKRVYEAQYKAYTKINEELVKLYWDIGKMIVEKQRKEEWGDATIKYLSEDLQNEFKGVKGFSVRNLASMKRYYLEYKHNENLHQLGAKIPWRHNVEVIQRCKDLKKREFYMRMIVKRGWSRATLLEKIGNHEFEKWAISQSNFQQTLPAELARKGEVIIKDDYNLSFLEITEEVEERKLENKIIEKVDKFIKEMNGDLMFAGRQVRLEVGEEEFFVDLLFYHKLMRSYIVIELKTTKFKPEYAGKMALYLGAVENKYNDLNHDNSAIGLILCKEKDRAVVDITLKVVARPIDVATYKTYEAAKLPLNLSKYLPNKYELERKLLELID